MQKHVRLCNETPHLRLVKTEKKAKLMTRDEVEELISSTKIGIGITEIEIQALKYIRSRYGLTDEAAELFDYELERL